MVAGPDCDPPLRRVWVLGTSGSGKSRLAGRVAARLGVPHVELDSLQHGPEWAQATPAELMARARAALAGGDWVVDGNYPAVRDALLAQAQLVVWLDLPRRLVMARVIRRTAARALLRRRLWNGNRERLAEVLGRDLPVRWAWRTHHRRRAELEPLMDARWVRLRTRREVEGLVANRIHPQAPLR